MPTATAPARPAKRRTRTPEGVITAIVAVTGVKDAVEDVIVPGAFTRTFGIRRPKVVFHHDWLRFLGRSLHYVELLPGDPRLPKRTKDGKPWPKEAGAVAAVMEFNLNVEAGRDGYEWARFYTESNECEWSIGYKVVPGKASKGRDGARYIYDLDVYEFSLVLFGAASLSMTIDVKSLEGHDDLEAKAVPFSATLLDEVMAEFQQQALEQKAAESMVGSGVMVALYPPAEVAEQLAVPDGTGPEDLHVTLAFLGDKDDWDGSDMQAVADSLTEAAQDPAWRSKVGAPPLTGSVGGLGQFPGGEEGPPTYVPVDVPGLESLREHLVDDLFRQGHGPRVAMNHGFTPHLTLGYALEGVEPVPPTDVSFDTVYLVVGDERYPIPLLAGEVKAAAAAVLEAKRMPVTRGHSAFDAVRQAKALIEGERPAAARVSRGSQPGTFGGKKRPAGKPATAKRPAQRASGGGSFDESKHKRAAKGATNGGQFVSKGAGYESAGRRDEAESVTKAQRALIDGGFLGENDGKDGRGDDGYFGDKTETAVKAWQTEMGYEPTGKLSGEQMDELTGNSDAATDDDEGREVTQDRDRQGRDKYLPNGEPNPAYGRATNVATVKGPRQRPMPPEPPRPVRKIRTERKSAWDTLTEARSMQTGMEVKYDTSSRATPGPDNWIEQVDGELDPFIRAVRNALMRERGKSESEATQIAIGRIQTWAAGGGDVTEKTRAKAVKAVAAWEALKAKAHATPPMEGKSMHELTGSFEAVRDQLRTAAQDLLCKKPQGEGPGASVDGEWVMVEATYPTHVIVNHETGGKSTTYQIPYTATGGEVSLGKPEEVTLKVVVEETNAKADADDEALVRFAQPAAGMLDEATALVMFGGAEGKSAEVLRPALLRLLDALAMKGMPDVHDDGEYDEPTPDGDSTDDEPADDDGPAAAEPLPEQLVDEPAEDDLEDDLEEKDAVDETDGDLEEKGLVVLDQDEVARELEALRA